MKARLKRLWKPQTLIWLALPPLLWWSVRQVPLGEIREVLGQLGLSQLALLAAFNLFAMLFFSSRWWLILRAQGYRLPYLWLLGYRTAAFSVSYFTPGTQFGGEPLQVYLLGNRHRLPGAAALASVSLDKLFELLANFTFLAAGIGLALQAGLLAGMNSRLAMLLAGGLILLPLAYLLALWSGRFPLTWLLARLSARLPARLFARRRLGQIPALAASSERQVSALIRNAPRVILGILLASALIWLLSLAEYWLALHLLGARLNLVEVVFALAAARIAFLTPLPGGLGALEASQVMAMQALGLSPALGISVSLWIRARDLALGIAGLWLGALLTQRRPVHPLPLQAGD
ncbi:MAG: flippase-like domain-containing protein [Anaerolineales bacterium]|nr:flippase-like domain-containing protein [Anaerolineales bacterium]